MKEKVKESEKVSILCVTHNRRNLVLKCLESCAAQKYNDLEIVLVVNGDVDETTAAVKKINTDIKVLTTEENIGFFPALNLAINAATGRYVMTVDDDAYFLCTDSIDKFVSALKKESELSAVTCSIEGPAELPPPKYDRYVHTFKTGFTMLYRKVFTEWVGLYPDVFFRSAGENYICTSLWNQGKRVKQLCDILMYHELSSQGRSHWNWKFYGLRSQILVVIMRDPWYLIAPRLFSKWIRSLFHCALKGALPAWFSAWGSAIVHIPAALRIREPITWQTQKLLWKLQKEVITDSSLLPKSIKV